MLRRPKHVLSQSMTPFACTLLDTEYDRAKVPPYNGNDPPPAPGSLKTLLFPPLFNNVENKGTQGVRARYGAELPPFISIVRYPGRPVILGKDLHTEFHFGIQNGQFCSAEVQP